MLRLSSSMHPIDKKCRKRVGPPTRPSLSTPLSFKAKRKRLNVVFEKDPGCVRLAEAGQSENVTATTGMPLCLEIPSVAISDLFRSETAMYQTGSPEACPVRGAPRSTLIVRNELSTAEQQLRRSLKNSLSEELVRPHARRSALDSSARVATVPLML